MKTIVKSAAIAAVVGVLAVAAITPSDARRRGWVGPAVGAGFVAGAVIGAAAANANAAYYDGYYGEPGYAYGPGPAYVAPYDGYGYYEPGYRYRSRDIERRHLEGTE